MKPKENRSFIICLMIFCLAVGFPILVSAAPPPVKAAAAADVPQSWLAKVQQDIAAREYHVSPVVHKGPASGGLLQAPNRQQNLRTWFTEDGILVRQRVKENQDWTFKLRPEAAGVAGAMHKLAFAQPKAEGSRVSYQSQYLEQWFENRPEGLEQGFTIPKPLGQGELLLRLAIEGNLKPTLKNDTTLSLQSSSGTTVLEYGHLVVTDAGHRTLPSRFSLAGSQLLIHVMTKGAAYPLTVDPLLMNPAWSSSDYGSSVSTAGDVNGDGYDDIIIGYPDYGDPMIQFCASCGIAYVYLGSAAGLATTPAGSISGGDGGDRFGYSVATAGDVNGDGYDDIIIGIPGYGGSPFGGTLSSGAASVYLGSAAGLATTSAWFIPGSFEGDYFGHSVATAGDVNGDGYDDVIIGAYHYGEDNEGAAFVYLGSATGLTTSPSWQEEFNQAGAHFGNCVASAGDINNDGYDDVIVGASDYSVLTNHHEGKAFVYLGSTSGLSVSPDWQIELDQSGARFGSSVSSAGDVNNDGCDDVIIGAEEYDNGEASEGAAFLYLGAPSGLASTPAWRAESDQENAHFGNCVALAGDVNNDGYDDIIIGAHDYDSEGKAFVYLGNINLFVTDWYADCDQPAAHFGYSVSSAGDVNNDGYDDIIIGAPDYDSGTNSNEGAAFVYLGSDTEMNINAVWTAKGGQENAHFGYSVSSAGDINNDGYDDIIIGAPDYDHEQIDEGSAFIYSGTASGISDNNPWRLEINQAGAHFGHSVSTAGDVNNDDYDDVVVGAPDYDNDLLHQNEGAVFAFAGTATGPNTNGLLLGSSSPGAHLGFSVSSAGDINNDGHDDVIAGAPDYGKNSQGAAFVWTGLSTGVTAPDWQVEGDQSEAHFGYSVSSAGDVNNDGYDEVIIGAPNYDNGESDEGAAFVYQGKSGNLGMTPTWQVESNQGNALLGCTVSSAGDINNDGYDDVVIGSMRYDNGESDEGAAFVYLGSHSGLNTTLVMQVESNQTNAWFGSSVSSAGDINNDGYDDIIIGAKFYTNGEINEGAAFLYQGSNNIINNSAMIDFNGDTTHDISLFYPDSHKWYVKDQSTPTYGTADCIPVPGDYDGDGSTDLAVVDLTRSDGRAKWYLDGVGVFIYGLQEWIPVAGDYDGDGSTDAALFDANTGKWYVKDQFITVYGAGGIPVPGDYDGDGTTDIAVFNPTNNKWYIKDIGIFTYGMADCIPVPADYDGDGATDLAVIDTSRPDGMAKWYIKDQAVFIYGAVADTIPVPGDYDGDGDADPCLFYQNTGKWYCRNVNVWTYGNGDMIPLASNLATRYAISQVAGGSTVW